MQGSSKDAGRVRQKRRTRRAILAAAVALVAEGKRPTVEEVADAADVSRRTAYRYFPTQEQLLTEAVLETLRPGMQAVVQPHAEDGTIAARLDALTSAMWESALDHERLLRTMIRLTVERGPSDDGETPRRGYRRIEWIEMALEQLRGRIDDDHFQRLVAALALCMGPEALLVLRDVCGLDESQSVSVSRWAAQALLAATVAE